MEKSMYIAASGASQAMLNQAITANSLANASTTGFKKDFASFMAAPVRGPGYQSSAFAKLEGQSSNFDKGAIMSTGNDLDMAVKGDGWIAVQTADGSEAYTRAGDLKITSTGQLVNGAGYAIKGNGGVITIPPAEKVEIAGDGTISIRPLGEAPANLAIVDRIKLVNPPIETLEKGADGLVRIKTGEPAVIDASINLISGALESSNVNPVAEMVSMIETARHFEMQMQVMKTAEQVDASSTQMLRGGG